MVYALRILGIFALLALGSAAIAQEKLGVTRTYYIAADEVDWDYVPSGMDMMMGAAPQGYAKFYTQHGPGSSARCTGKPSTASTRTRRSRISNPGRRKTAT